MRRSALLLAGLATLAPVLALSEPIAAETQGAPFMVPDEPVILTRTVRRPLPDGKEVVSRRSYSVRFSRDGDGYLVDGELISAKVDAPPSLRALSDIEEARPDTGLFPIRLDAHGRIRPDGTVRTGNGETLRQGTGHARERIEQSQLSADEKAQAIGFVQQLLDRGGTRTPWPEDLFHPRPGSHKVTRQVALPGGGSGQVTVATQARLARTGGLLEQVDREVTTDLEGDRRTIIESWTLRPVGAPL